MGKTRLERVNGVRELPFDYHGFATTCYVVSLRKKVALIDTGSALAAETVVIPKLKEIGIEKIAAIVDTHAHVDHSGGSNALARETGVPVTVHGAEAKWLADRRLAFDDWFGSWRNLVPATGYMKREFLTESGGNYSAPRIIGGGGSRVVESLELLHTPGHSPGSMSVYSEAGGYLFTGDSVQGEGTAPYGWTIPLYDDVDAYRGSLEEISRRDPDVILTAHPLKPASKSVFVGDEAGDLIAASLEALGRLHSEVSAIVVSHRVGIGLLDVAQEVSAKHGSSWLQPVGTFVMRTIAAHLKKMEADRRVERSGNVYRPVS